MAKMRVLVLGQILSRLSGISSMVWMNLRLKLNWSNYQMHRVMGHRCNGAHGRRPGAELWGDGKNFAHKNFWMTFFNDKIFIFTQKISDDLSLVIDQIFEIFPVFTVCEMWYMTHICHGPFFSKKSLFQKKFLDDTFFLLSSYFRTHPTTLFLKILGGRMHLPPPTSNFWGKVPPKSPPMLPNSKHLLFILEKWQPSIKLWYFFRLLKGNVYSRTIRSIVTALKPSAFFIQSMYCHWFNCKKKYLSDTYLYG